MVCEFLDSFNFKNDIDYSIALNILIEAGLFSVSSNFRRLSNYDETGEKDLPEIELFSHLGMNIVLAEGNYRHFASFHDDIMKKLEKDSRRFYCTAYKEGKEEPVGANHIANTINHNGKRYVIDIYNDCILFSFVDCMKARQISSDEHEILAYRPHSEIIFDNGDIESIKKEMYINETSAFLPSISEEEYNNEFGEILDLLTVKKDRLVGFNRSTKGTKKKIEKGLRLTKK